MEASVVNGRWRRELGSVVTYAGHKEHARKSVGFRSWANLVIQCLELVV
jgi:hypothetical protein